MTELTSTTGMSSSELVEVAGITYRQLDYWTRHGHLEPIPGTDRRGHGYPRRYPTTEAPHAWLMGQLMTVGIRDLDLAADLARRLRHTNRADIELERRYTLRLTLTNGARR